MARRTKQADTLFELAVARVARARGEDPARSIMAGLRAVPRAQKVVQYVAQWAIASNELGKFATTAEYAEWWGVEERTGWRHRAVIHEAFPGDEMKLVVEAVRRSSVASNVGAAMKVPVAGLA